MTIKPTLPQALLFAYLQGILVIRLHLLNHLEDYWKAKMQNLLNIEILHLNNILRKFGKGSGTYFFCTQNWNIHQLPWLLCNALQDMVELLSLIGIHIIASQSKSNEAIRVDSYHIAIILIVFFPSCEELLVYFNCFLQFSSRLVNNKKKIIKDYENDLLRVRFSNESKRILLQIFPVSLEDGEGRGTKLSI